MKLYQHHKELRVFAEGILVAMIFIQVVAGLISWLLGNNPTTILIVKEGFGVIADIVGITLLLYSIKDG